MKPVIVRQAAEDDIAAAYAWYEKERPGLGEDFLDSVQTGLLNLSSRPEAFPVVYAGARRVLLKRFPYGLFFRAFDDAIYVLACTHCKRHPKVWKSQVRERGNE